MCLLGAHFLRSKPVLITFYSLPAESPCPAIDDNDYDEFAKQISLTKHGELITFLCFFKNDSTSQCFFFSCLTINLFADVGAQITPLCIVSQQKADSHDETPFGLPLPQLFDKQFLEHGIVNAISVSLQQLV